MIKEQKQIVAIFLGREVYIVLALHVFMSIALHLYI